MDPHNARALLGKDVIATHYYGGQTRGTLIGIVGEPSYIVETPDGERTTLGHTALRRIAADERTAG